MTVQLEKKVDMCETWQSKTSPVPKLEGYSYIHKYRKHKLGGGVGIFVNKKLKYKERSDLYMVECSFEHCIIEVKLKHENLMVCSGYIVPNTNHAIFLSDYEKFLNKVNVEKNKLIVGIDHNLDLLKHRTHAPTKKFVEMLETFHQLPSITRPTHITKTSATLLENIFVSSAWTFSFDSYLLIDNMSDHLPVIIVLRNVELCKKSIKTIKIRDTHPQNLEILKLELTNIDWKEYLSVNDVTTENLNHVFNKCHDKVLDIINKHAPIRKRIVTEKNFRKETWIRPSILKCCKEQKRLYKQSIKKECHCYRNH